jgi:protein-tyrosine phosphatase
MDRISVLFVCLGNICRSPMAEAIFKKITTSRGVSDQFFIDSAGISGFHQGEMADTRMRQHGALRGYHLTSLSRPVKKSDLDEFHWIIAMDDSNYEALNRIAKHPSQFAKIHRMTDFCAKGKASHIPDPYYGGDKGFENVIDLLEDCCEGLLNYIKDGDRK